MVFIIQAVGVCIVGVGKPQLLCLGVHLLHTAGNGAVVAKILRQRVGAVVGALQLGAVDHILQRYHLAGQQRNVGGVGFQTVGHIVIDGQLGGPVALCLFHGEPQGHDLGDRGRTEHLVGILFHDDLAGVRVHDHIGLARSPGAGPPPQRWGPAQLRPAQRRPILKPVFSNRIHPLPVGFPFAFAISQYTALTDLL